MPDMKRTKPIASAPTSANGILPTTKIKVGSLKLWFLEFGPFELTWPLHISYRQALIYGTIGLGLILLAIAAPYFFVVNPTLITVHNFLRRGEYVKAGKEIEALPKWATSWPVMTKTRAQVNFGMRLAAGEHIRNLDAELGELVASYPNESTVLMFQGIRAYYVLNDSQKASDFFTQAVARDGQHVEAAMLLIAQQVDIAYQALGEFNPAKAKMVIKAAKQRASQITALAPYANTLPKYASHMAELLELE